MFRGYQGDRNMDIVLPPSFQNENIYSKFLSVSVYTLCVHLKLMRDTRFFQLTLKINEMISNQRISNFELRAH